MKVSPSEELTRFIRRESHFSSNGVKSDAFIPSPRRIDVSVFRISALGDSERLLEDEIWEIGWEHIKPKMVARADLFAADIYMYNLEVAPDDFPPRHANIMPFPKLTDPTNLTDPTCLGERKARRVLANKLAKRSMLVPLPTKT